MDYMWPRAPLCAPVAWLRWVLGVGRRGLSFKVSFFMNHLRIHKGLQHYCVVSRIQATRKMIPAVSIAHEICVFWYFLKEPVLELKEMSEWQFSYENICIFRVFYLQRKSRNFKSLITQTARKENKKQPPLYYSFYFLFSDCISSKKSNDFEGPDSRLLTVPGVTKKGWVAVCYSEGSSTRAGLGGILPDFQH